MGPPRSFAQQYFVHTSTNQMFRSNRSINKIGSELDDILMGKNSTVADCDAMSCDGRCVEMPDQSNSFFFGWARRGKSYCSVLQFNATGGGWCRLVQKEERGKGHCRLTKDTDHSDHTAIA